MSRERFLELVSFCDRNHDFEAELAAVTSPEVLRVLAEKNISAVNFSALEAQHVP